MAMEFDSEREEVGSRRVYDPVGFCIYCAATDCTLTDEHPVPEGFGGRHILPKASCTVCQKIINEEFEQYVLRTFFGLARAAFDIRSKRKRPRVRPSIRVRRANGFLERVYFDDPNDVPPIFFMPVWPTPFFLQGKAAPSEFEGLHWAWQPQDTLKDLNAVAVVSEPIVPMKFARFLAKMAHSYAVAVLGAEFFNPWLQEIILGRDKHYIHFVGGSLEVRPPETEAAFMLGLVPYRRQTDGHGIVAAHIRLFPMIGCPDYIVVIGELLKPWPDGEPDFRPQTS